MYMHPNLDRSIAPPPGGRLHGPVTASTPWGTRVTPYEPSPATIADGVGTSRGPGSAPVTKGGAHVPGGARTCKDDSESGSSDSNSDDSEIAPRNGVTRAGAGSGAPVAAEPRGANGGDSEAATCRICLLESLVRGFAGVGLMELPVLGNQPLTRRPPSPSPYTPR